MFREHITALLFAYPLASTSRDSRLMAAARAFIRKWMRAMCSRAHRSNEDLCQKEMDSNANSTSPRL